jgi:hypothetical protein
VPAFARRSWRLANHVPNSDALHFHVVPYKGRWTRRLHKRTVYFQSLTPR